MKRHIIVMLIILWGGVSGNWTKASAFSSFQEDEYMGYGLSSGEMLSESDVYPEASGTTGGWLKANPSPGAGPAPGRESISAKESTPVSGAHIVPLIACLLYGLHKRRMKSEK